MSEIKENKIRHTIEAQISIASLNAWLGINGVTVEGIIERIELSYNYKYDTLAIIKVSSVKEDRLKEIEYTNDGDILNVENNDE